MQHLNRLLIYAVIQGELPGGLIARIAVRHMLDGCLECRREWELAKASLDQRIQPTTSHVVASLLGHHARTESSLRAAARRDFNALMRLPEKDRAERIGRARKRFQGPHLIQLLLETSHEVITRSPGEALHLAKLAETVATRASTSEMDLDLYVLALAQVGNASRAAGRFNDADDAFLVARKIIVNEGVEDPALLARVDDLESSLRRDQRRLDDAEVLLARALLLYGMLEPAPVTDKARILIKMGNLYQLKGSLIEAVEVTEIALRALAESKEQEPKLYFAAMYNLALFCVDLGNVERASKILTAHQQIIEGTQEPLYLARVTGLRGKIAAVQGDVTAAEEAFLQTRDAFLDHGDAYVYDAAIVSLDLALLYAKQRRAAELRDTVESMVSIFRANELHQEALAAVLLLQDSLKTANLESLIRDVLAYMRQAQQNPTLRYQPRRRR
jgi:tetratricopeptide (TPR) repeat protein